MKGCQLVLGVFVGLLGSAIGQGWELSTWSGSECDTSLTSSYIVPPPPSVGVCPTSDPACISFANSHSFEGVTLGNVNDWTLYILAFEDDSCQNELSAYSLTYSACFNVNTGTNVGSLKVFTGVCGSPF
jgi:hypothetical protein